MTETDIRYGIIGCASMGETHAEALAQTEGAELVASADVADDVARSFGDAHDCAWYTDHEAMLDDADLDAVSVCTPNGTHADVVPDVAAAGADVLCEKPLDVRPDRVDRLVEACREADVTLSGIFQRRTLPEMRLARDAVRSGELGRLVLADVQVKWHREQSYYDEASWRGTSDLDGGVLLTQALHGIDLLQWIAGDVIRVSAGIDTLHHDVEVPDTAALTLGFENGAFGQVTATTATQPQYPITLQFHGTEGSLRVHQGGVDAYETDDGAVAYDLADYEFPHGPEHVGQIRDFVEAIREGSEPMVPAEEARVAPDVVFAASESDRRGEWVAVDRDA